MRIKILSDEVINKIAAGEVVERPASVVKELVENSIDAGADHIIVEIVKSGKRLIKISDDGIGMEHDDAIMAFERHATSKIDNIDDIEKIGTFGFRGEALPCIVSVSQLELITKNSESSIGTKIVIHGGKIRDVVDTGAPNGTVIILRNLFFNVPARMKFLKADRTEYYHILDILTKFAMVLPQTRFTFISNGKEIFDCIPVKNLKERLKILLGKQVADRMYDFDITEGDIRIHGFIGHPDISQRSYQKQYIFLNNRPVTGRQIRKGIDLGYEGYLMKGRYPVGIFFIEMPAGLADVNIHPQKLEVKFLNPYAVKSVIIKGIRDTLRSEDLMLKDLDSKDLVNAINIQTGNESIIQDKSKKEGEKPLFQDEYYSQSSTEVYKDTKYISIKSDLKDNETKLLEDFFGKNCNILGQVFNSYILVISKESLYLVDQHAANEKILYERIRDNYNKEKVIIQQLLFPEPLELGLDRKEILKAHLKYFERIGFEIKSEQEEVFTITGIPEILSEKIPAGSYSSLIDLILGDLKAQDKTDILEHLFESIACKASAKANDELHPVDMKNLLIQLVKCENPYNCPHGRPTTIKFTLDKIEKLFKRK